jgi:lipopolysaccharide transport system ATP-binding protein
MTKKSIAIRVRDLGKQYKIKGPQEPYHTFREVFTHALKAPIKNFPSKSPSEGFWALKDVSFEVERGEVIGIIGRNGAGKSTLLKILSRITSPTEGSVEIHGRVGSLLEVGTGFHSELTGRENIYLSGSILGMKRREIDGKLDDIVKFSGIEKFLDTPVKRYSSGMYVRLAFAVAAHLDTDILLVDEVLAVGDAEFQKKCLGKMGEVAECGRTVFFVSHNMGAIEALCNRGIAFNAGNVHFDGESRDAISRYLNTYHICSNTSLISRNDRSGDGSIKIVEITIGLEDEINCGYWRTGENCIIQFKYVKNCNEQISNIDIGFVIEDSYGRKLFYANTIVEKKRLSLSKCDGIIYCKLERFPLSSGNYYLTYDIYENDILIDKVQHACVITIENRDFNDTLTSWGGYGTICAIYQWLVE